MRSKTTAYSRKEHACRNTRVLNMHAHTCSVCICIPNAQGPSWKHTKFKVRTHVPTALTHVCLKAAERGARREGRGWGGLKSHFSEALHPRKHQRHPLPTPPLLRFTGPNTTELCISSGWHPSAPHTEKAASPSLIHAKDRGQALRPARRKADQKETLVRYWAGGPGG